MPRPMRALTVLILSDGRPGHYHLAEGVAAAIARRRPVRLTKLDITQRQWLPGRLGALLLKRQVSPRFVLGAGYGLARDTLPAADLVISAGGDTLNANVAAARLLGAPNIFCGTLRRLPPEAFSLIMSSYARHAGLPRHLVALKPNGIDPDRLRTSDKAGVSSRLAGLLVGGDSGLFHYTKADWDHLLAFLTASHAAHGRRWVVSTSRRSPDDVADRLLTLAARSDGPIAELIDFRVQGPGTLPRLFAGVTAILCTEDSSTMLSEAVCARLPVVGVAPRQHDFKDEEREYRAFMRDQNWCRFVPLAELTPERFQSALAEVHPLTENHLDRLAAQIAERLPQLFAPA